MLKDIISCGNGFSIKANRPIMITGDVNGMYENKTAIFPSGLVTALCIKTNEIIKGNVTGITNCWVSVSESIADPIAANIDE